MIDPHFRVEVIAQTPNPQQLTWAAMRQDYSEGFVWDSHARWADETKAGELVVKHLLKGGKGHYGPLEHAQIAFNAGGFSHSTMQQLRTHRVGVSFDVQSFRYTGQRLMNVADAILRDPQYEGYTPGICRMSPDVITALENVIYLRPEGQYSDRQGKRYNYTWQCRFNDLALAGHCITHYARNIESGLSEEHARGLIPFDVRQNFVMSCNLRSLMHLLDLRAKADAQLEAQQFCELLMPHFRAWAPAIAEWYEQTRLGKARLAP